MILDLVRLKGIEPRRVSGRDGGEYHSECPKCGGADIPRKPGDPPDRFIVFPQQNDGKGSWYCRSCRKGGDAIEFLRWIDGLSYRDACAQLEIPMQAIPNTWKRAPKPPADAEKPAFVPDPDAPPPSSIWMDRAGKLVEWAHGQLLENAEQLAWLKARGILKESVVRWKLGWLPEDLYRPRKAWNLPPEQWEDGREKKLKIRAGLVIPWMSQAGQVLRIRVRPIDGKPKYWVFPGSSTDCWVSRPGCRAYVIIEAELDGILVAQEAGDICGAIPLGNDTRKPEASTWEQLRKAAVVLNALDFDKAGAKAGAWWQEHLSQCRRWPVPNGKDPGDAVKDHRVNIREWIRAGLPKAWSIGPFPSLDSFQGGGEKEEVSSESASGVGPGASIPDGVRELARVLAGTPVFIELGDDTLCIRESEPWALSHFPEAQRIRDLIFSDQKVFEYLDSWGIGRVTGENILTRGAK